MTIGQTGRRATALAITALVAVFVSGVLAGAALQQRRPHDQLAVNVRVSSRLPDELRRLGLSPQQEDSLRAILRVGSQHIGAVLAEMEPRLRAGMDSVENRIRQQLTPEQRAKFDAGHRRRDQNEVEIDTVHR